mmetsp:Transcript_6942/g.12009  ORF Transcript_6942/g.12009 Transcript_6942/m.12009 type:complete len:373 (-) Transcript_6942:69-1187(-)|eukprot:CAMPEP_0198213008 /NCGR_PEP_ID=MMETSP1445-20131203/28598_1 /TAXON_ID=36898 /ORGANISM="Pyramimonas sp., Strain CCMP2087" /LENGTH=372 /DNA_ID=CAMNT_0043887597 /DNA_START=312 /DNA_END=1430 /DNA_ORIENTATION=+
MAMTRSLFASTSHTLGLLPVSRSGSRSSHHSLQRSSNASLFATRICYTSKRRTSSTRRITVQATGTSSFDDMRFESFNASTFDSLDGLDETFDDNDKPLNMVMVGGLVDFYQLLDVAPEAERQVIKKAYYGLTKECHPDIYGDDGHNMCILLNQAYETLSDLDNRATYDRKLKNARLDEEAGFTGQPLSKWCGPQEETRAIFVDECTCIGCKNCVWQAPATFRMEPTHGRSQVFAQWLNDENELQDAIDSCPVDCIHWVDRAQLPLLEFVMKDLNRVGVGIMAAGNGNVGDPFSAAASFAKKRAEQLERQKKEDVYGSPAQQEARRQAAEGIKKKAAGFAARWGWPKVEKKEPTYSVPSERGMVVTAKDDDK